jgi:hypothetical protein
VTEHDRRVGLHAGLVHGHGERGPALAEAYSARRRRYRWSQLQDPARPSPVLVNVPTLLGVIAGAAVTAFLYWLPRSDMWRQAREQQRRAISLLPMSDKRFEQIERANQILLPLIALIVTVGLLFKLVIEAI